MTEPEIRDRIDGVEAHKFALARWAEELGHVEDACRHFGGFRKLVLAAGTLERIGSEIAQALVAIERLWPADASEQTDRIIVTGAETCSRCAGTGEVPIVEPVP